MGADEAVAHSNGQEMNSGHAGLREVIIRERRALRRLAISFSVPFPLIYDCVWPIHSVPRIARGVVGSELPPLLCNPHVWQSKIGTDPPPQPRFFNPQL